MPLNGFTPNTKIESAKVTANFTNLSDHSRWFTKQFIFPIAALYVQTGVDWVSFPDDILITEVDAIVNNAPAGSAIIVDIEKSSDNGASWATIFTGGTNRPQIADGARVGSTTTIDIPSGVANTTLYRPVISQVGSGTPGGYLSILMKGQYPLD